MKVMLIITVVSMPLAALGGHLALRGDSGRGDSREHNRLDSRPGTVSANGLVEGWSRQQARPSATGEIYPPALTGMRGSGPGMMDAAHAMRDGNLCGT